ncbi:putative quinol monooxygenase [uncultured Roseobacter sp.]|uniref:putative quinol monooxygenase n=1 Tax=uncultured Roseobacter sp. TaxID=114847 RepID=UPI00263A2754|nr:putative quinol monooxygenase [uncultured Roseobacter sp.]
MYAVVVTFTIKSNRLAEFLPLMEHNARASLANEPGCHQFDIATDPARLTEVFLYELYEDETAFRQHLKTQHFKEFDAAAADMIKDKSIRTYATVIQ